jgi:hypothetical protein
MDGITNAVSTENMARRRQRRSLRNLVDEEIENELKKNSKRRYV